MRRTCASSACRRNGSNLAAHRISDLAHVRGARCCSAVPVVLISDQISKGFFVANHMVKVNNQGRSFLRGEHDERQPQRTTRTEEAMVGWMAGVPILAQATLGSGSGKTHCRMGCRCWPEHPAHRGHRGRTYTHASTPSIQMSMVVSARVKIPRASERVTYVSRNC